MAFWWFRWFDAKRYQFRGFSWSKSVVYLRLEIWFFERNRAFSMQVMMRTLFDFPTYQKTEVPFWMDQMVKKMQIIITWSFLPSLVRIFCVFVFVTLIIAMEWSNIVLLRFLFKYPFNFMLYKLAWQVFDR